MVSRERLVNTAESVARVATARRTRAAGQVLLLVTLVFVLVRVRSIWHDSSIDLAGVDWWALIGALLIAAAGVAASAFIWLVILERLGLRTRPRWVSIFFQAQLDLRDTIAFFSLNSTANFLEFLVGDRLVTPRAPVTN